MFNRSFYDICIQKNEQNNNVILFRGVRGAGKTTLLTRIKDSHPNSNVIFIDFDRVEWDFLKKGDALKDYLKQILSTSDVMNVSDKPIILIAEVQNADNCVEQLEFVQKTSYCQIYATYSRGEVAGNCSVINTYPLSFAEYLQINNYNIEEKDRYFSEYLGTCSFVQYFLTTDMAFQQNIVESIFNSIYLKDIILTGLIKNEEAFRRVVKYLMENIGTYISAYNISKEQTAAGYKIASDTVDGYLNILCDSNLTDYCMRYDIRKKELLKTNGRYYVVDLALRDFLLGKRSAPSVNLLKNVVYYELKRRNQEVFSGWNPEVDFIAKTGSNQSYYMVDVSIEDNQRRDAYIDTLGSIRDNYPKYILTLDSQDYSYNGIIHKNIVEFLLEK